MRKILVISMLIALLPSTLAMAHSVRVDVNMQSPAVIVFAGFSKTKPIADARVEVFAPGSTTPFQLGRTDINGYFAFLPKTPGEWKISIDDEMGHFGKKSINVPQEFLPSEEPVNQKETIIEKEVKIDEQDETKETTFTHTTEIPMVYKAIFGLALIFGITGILYGINANKKSSSKN